MYAKFLFLMNSCSTANYGGTEDFVKIYVNQLVFLGTQGDSRKAGQEHCDKYDRDAEFVESSRIYGYDLYKCIDRNTSPWSHTNSIQSKKKYQWNQQFIIPFPLSGSKKRLKCL